MKKSTGVVRSGNIFLPAMLFIIFSHGLYAQDNALVIEAEHAKEIGSDFEIVTEGEVTFLTPTTDFASASNPGIQEKVITFEVTFPAPGTYDLYVKLRVGPDGFDDDSFYFANTFGDRPADEDPYWVRVNSIDYGATEPHEYVLTPEENTAGNGVFKWINASERGEGAQGGTLFIVEESNATLVFQMGAREDGLDIDKIAFGNADLFLTSSVSRSRWTF